MPAKPPLSLTARLGLAVALVLGLGAIGVTVAALAYGRQASREAYDRLLIGAADQIAGSISIIEGQPVVDLPMAAFELLALAPEDRVAYRVIDKSGTTLTGYPDLPAVARPGVAPLFSDGALGPDEARLVQVTRPFAERAYSGPVVVIVAQTTRARAALAWEITRSALLVLGLVGASMSLLAVFAVRSALRPLRRIGGNLARRDPRDLTPVGIAVPREIDPMVAAINNFMARLERQVTGMRNLIADSAHQLRTPVAALRVQAELALDEPDPARTREILSRIHARSLGLSRLTDQLLNRAMVIHRADSVPATRIDLRAVALRALEQFDPDGDKDIRLDLPDDPVEVAGDAVSLGEACKNLLNNAVRYGKPPVSLVVHHVGDRCRLAIVDMGAGIPPEQRGGIGRRFSGTSQTRPDSAGIGLAIVVAVARAHEGALDLRTLPEGGFEAALVLPEARA